MRNSMIVTKKQILSIFFAFVGIGRCLHTDTTLVVQLKHAPAEIRKEVEALFQKQQDVTKFGNDLEQTSPGKFNETMIKSTIRKYLQPKLSGFTFLYGGYTDISDPDGLVSFPLRHSGDELTVAISPSVELVKLAGNTIAYTTFKNKTKRYLFTKKVTKEKKEDSDEEIETHYWEVKEEPIQKEERIDASKTLVILTDSSNIAILPGNYLSTKSAQYILPYAFLVIGDTNNEKILLKGLNFKSFFERIETEEKTTDNNIKQRRIKNL